MQCYREPVYREPPKKQVINKPQESEEDDFITKFRQKLEIERKSLVVTWEQPLKTIDSISVSIETVTRHVNTLQVQLTAISRGMDREKQLAIQQPLRTVQNLSVTIESVSQQVNTLKVQFTTLSEGKKIEDEPKNFREKQLEAERDEAVAKCEVAHKEIRELKAENKKLKAERDEAVQKYERVVKDNSSKNETSSNGSNSTRKGPFGSSQSHLEQLSNFVEIESNGAPNDSDEAKIILEWKNFYEQFKKLHKTLSSILLKTAESRNSTVLVENMKIAKELSDAAEIVKRDFLTATKKCTETIKEVLQRHFKA